MKGEDLWIVYITTVIFLVMFLLFLILDKIAPLPDTIFESTNLETYEGQGDDEWVISPRETRICNTVLLRHGEWRQYPFSECVGNFVLPTELNSRVFSF